MNKNDFLNNLDSKLLGTLYKIANNNPVIKSAIAKNDSIELFCNRLMAAIIYEYDRDLKEKEKIKNMLQTITSQSFVKGKNKS